MSLLQAIRRISNVFLFAVMIALSTVADAADGILRVSTTTSTANSGLIEKLMPVFESKYSLEVHTIVGGTGRALNHARNGDVDLIMVHAKQAELELIAMGYGVDRHEFMFNEFIIVGPEEDPAQIHNMQDLSAALNKIAEAKASFVSRGDDSGTHKKELSLWASLGFEPQGDWYIDVGLGMGKALQIADELDAYVLTDKGTWLFMADRLSLPVHVQGAADGKNIYGVISVNPAKHPHVNYEGARHFTQWLKSDEAKSIIAGHKVNGEQLFFVIE